MVSCRKSGQAATEYLVVVALALFLLSPIILLGQNSIRDTEDYSARLEARQALDKISEAAKLVYAQGEPSRITIFVRIPDVDNAVINNQTLIYTINTSGRVNDEVADLDFPVQGTLPSTSGRHKLLISAIGNYVNISVQ